MTDLGAMRQASFRQLAAIVAQFVDDGRTTRAASLKPAMQTLEKGFDERRLGYRSFRAFLEAAQEAGYVTLHRAPTGPDIDVLPVGATATPPTDEQRPGRIRNDMWSAFVDWRKDWDRVYDRETDRVVWLPHLEGPDERGPLLRRAIMNDPSRYIRIEPITQDTTLAWMNEFLNSLSEGPEHEALASALASPTPIRAFVLRARESGVEERWKKRQFDSVRQRIETWADGHGLKLDLTTGRRPLGLPQPGGRFTRQRVVVRSSLDDLRDRVCSAVRKMSRAELLQLAIPLEYVLDDEDR